MSQNLLHQVEQAFKLQQAKKYDRAKAIYLKVLKSDPNYFDVLGLLGILYNSTGEYQKAIGCFNRAIKINPSSPSLYHNIGLAYKKMKNNDEAISYYKKALTLNPNYAEAMEKLGNAYADNEQFTLAIDYLNQAIRLKPSLTTAWLSLGKIHQTLLDYTTAKNCYQKVIEQQPNNAAAYLQLGYIARELRDYEFSKKCYEKASRLYPKLFDPKVEHALLLNLLCDWENYEERIAMLHRALNDTIKQGLNSPISGLSVFPLGFTAEELLISVQSNMQLVEKASLSIRDKLNFDFQSRKKNSRLRIGYFSSDLRAHPVSHLVNNLFSNHDRSKFEIFVFSHGPNMADRYRDHIKATAEHFIDVRPLSYLEIAKMIYENNIDILIDFNGHTTLARPNVLALRPAPIQAHYLGYLGTYGANFIDYTFVDNFVITPETYPYYSEKLIFLPHCYMITDNEQPISNQIVRRQDYQLPENAFVFCCFNGNHKIDPLTFSVWMDILRQCENSILWLLATTDIQIHNLRQAAQKAKINSDRLIFAQRESKDIHLARHRLADLFLDTYYCNAHTTTVDSLWAGLPVLTCPSFNFCGRAAGSAVKAAGLPELIMPNLEAYRERAIYFYNQPDELKRIRQKLIDQRNHNMLFDTKRFVANLEQAYEQMWEIHERGESPCDIHIQDLFQT